MKIKTFKSIFVQLSITDKKKSIKVLEDGLDDYKGTTDYNAIRALIHWCNKDLVNSLQQLDDNIAKKLKKKTN